MARWISAVGTNGLAHNGQLTGFGRSCGVPVLARLSHALLPYSRLPLQYSRHSLNPIRVRDFCCADRLHGTESSPPAGAPKRTAHAAAARLAPWQGGPGPPAEAEVGRPRAGRGTRDGDALKDSRSTIDTLQCMQCHSARMAFLQSLWIEIPTLRPPLSASQWHTMAH